ncbi:hypothetical protein [Pasteuria penetrans]|uniref:hypothetical protein n=1 Tax=Pasteuria penetrans TaxID=86005 RepID=UPI000F9E4C16|nr:hypothetical protein [Pasteuria penetrans]
MGWVLGSFRIFNGGKCFLLSGSLFLLLWGMMIGCYESGGILLAFSCAIDPFDPVISWTTVSVA